MASRTPVVRQISWRVAAPSLIVVVTAMVTGFYVGGPNGVLAASIAGLAYSTAARSLVPREHRRGMRLVRRGRFADAVPHFERSFDFFDRHGWLDEWRGLVLLSSSRASYREISLFNAAFCLSQSGETGRATDTDRRCLRLFPESGMAVAALRMMGADCT